MYAGGTRFTTLRELLAKKPCDVITIAVRACFKGTFRKRHDYKITRL